MASVTLILKENKINDKGEIPLYIRIIKGRKPKFISLGIKVHPDLWDKQKSRVKSKYPNSGRVNAFIGRKIADAENMAITMETKGEYLSSRKIKEAIVGKKSISFFDFSNEYLASIKSKGKIGTYRRVKAILSKLKTYLKKEDINFEEFDLSLLKKYDTYLRSELKNKQNTIHSNLKILKNIFVTAVREEVIDSQHNPFTKFIMATEKTKKII